jgi:GTPase
MKKNMKTKIAIIGKTNTGKSTLFNRLIGFRKAIVLKEAGITRDRNHADFSWQGRSFTLIDTGGIDYDEKHQFIQGKILEQSKKAILESHIIIYLLDVMTGIQQEDIDFARFIKKMNKKTILVVNKNDIKDQNYFLSDFFRLGLGEPCIISAEQGTNIGELLAKISKLDLEGKYNNENKAKECIIKVAIIGKPNVGKSSILNTLLNEERIVVDDYPGTTRDAIEASLIFNEYRLDFIDTAGLRRKRSVKDKIEYYGNLRTLDSIKKADVVLLVLDASHYTSMQDKRLAKTVMEEKKACVVLLNKYDIVLQQKEVDRDTLLTMSRYELRFLRDTPTFTTIAVGPKKNISKILNTIVELFQQYNKKISTSELNRFLQKIVNQNLPKIVNGRRLHYFYITQIGTKPPTFKVFVNNHDLLYNSYQRYLENKFIQYFGFKGIPIVFHYQDRKIKK